MINLQNQGVGANTPKGSRIDHAIEAVGGMTRTVERTTERIVSHARSLGYFEPPKDGQATPSAVVTTLSDALLELERAIQRNSDALNLFD